MMKQKSPGGWGVMYSVVGGSSEGIWVGSNSRGMEVGNAPVGGGGCGTTCTVTNRSPSSVFSCSRAMSTPSSKAPPSPARVFCIWPEQVGLGWAWELGKFMICVTQ